MRLQKLRDSSKLLVSINDKQEQRVRFHRTRAETFVAVDLVLQSLLLNGVLIRSSSPSRKPNEWLIPFAAILLSSVVFFAAFLEAAFSFYMTQFELDRNYLDLEWMRRAIDEAERWSRNKSSSSSSYLLKVNKVPIDQSSVTSGGDEEVQDPEVVMNNPSREASRPDPVRLFQRKFFIYVTFFALVGFTATELYACRLFLRGQWR